MGGVCTGCLKGSAKEDKDYYQGSQYPPFPQQPLPQPVQQRTRPLPQQPQPQQKQQKQQRTTEEDLARSDEARSNAAIAAQKRAEAFEKSAGGRAARTAIAAAKANSAPSRNDTAVKDWLN